MSSEFPVANNDYSCPPCRDEDHRHCRRTLHWQDWQQDCACYRDKVKAHGRLFHEVAIEKMRATLSSDGWIVVPPNTVLEVYQVSIVSTWYTGTRYTPHLTLEGAKADAQARLDEFAHLIDTSTEEERNSTEELSTRTLEWNDEEDWIMIGRERIVSGEMVPIAWFSKNSAFKITKEKIQP